MPNTDEAIAKVQAAIVAAQAAAKNLTDALGELPAKAATTAQSQFSGGAVNATDQASAAISAATEHLSKGASALASAVKSAADKAASAIPKP